MATSKKPAVPGDENPPTDAVQTDIDTGDSTDLTTLVLELSDRIEALESLTETQAAQIAALQARGQAASQRRALPAISARQAADEARKRGKSVQSEEGIVMPPPAPPQAPRQIG